MPRHPHPDFNPSGAPPKLTGRKSTITGLFFTTFTPYIAPSADEVDEALAILKMSRGSVSCAYCGGRKSEWDHFRPIVRHRKPTGYITEIQNLVPSCGRCNQSKSGSDWRDWMLGTAESSPSSLKVPNLRERIDCLAVFESWKEPTRIPHAELVDPDAWTQHLQYLDDILKVLEAAEQHAAPLREVFEKAARQLRK
jgi:hypothetical protein